MGVSSFFFPVYERLVAAEPESSSLMAGDVDRGAGCRPPFVDA